MAKRKESDADGDRVVMETTVEDLPVELTDADMLHRGRELARESAEVQKAEERKSQVVATCKAEIELHASRVSLLTNVLNQGWEHRSVEVDEVHIFPENRVALVRRDTGEVIRERPMTPHERQRPLPIVND